MKKLTALLAATAAVANLMPAALAARLNISEDFENFDKAGKYITASDAGYKIAAEDSNYLIVPGGAPKSGMPTIAVNWDSDLTLEFDTKTDGTQQSKIEAKFEDMEYYDLFQFLEDGRGPILRESDQSPFFLYKSGDKIPAIGEWHHFKIDFKYETKTLAVEVDGVPIEKYYGRNYVDATPTFSGAKIEYLRLSNDINKTGDACFDNVMVYAQGSLAGEAAPADDRYAAAYKKAERLSGVPDMLLDYPIDQSLTRGEMLTLIMQTVGLNISAKSSSAFEDVSPDAEYAAAVNMAAMLGWVSSGVNFRPDEPIKLSEAVTVMCNILGYDTVAASGGWPEGYMSAAYDHDLMDNINVVDYSQYVNVKDAYILAENMLTAPMMVKKVTSSADATIEEDDGMTVLYKYHGLKQIKCKVDKYDEKSRLITFTELGGKTYTAEYTASEPDIADTIVYAWVDKDYENVFYTFPLADSAVVYGYITEVNSTDAERSYKPEEIRRIAATNCVRTSLASGAEIAVDGAAAGTVSPIGKYARIVVSKGEIVKIDFYSLIRGGIIEAVGTERIIYTSGAAGYSVLEDIEEDSPARVIIDDTLSTLKNLKAGMYFDYVLKDGKLTVVASSNSAQGTLTETSSDGIYIKTEQKELYFDIDPSDFYIAEGEEDYSAEPKPSEFMGLEVSVYADTSGMAHYMKSAEKNEFYAVVVSSEDDTGENEKPIMTLAKIENGAIVQKTYEVKLKSSVIYYPEVSFEEAALNRKKTDGSGIYKFSVKNNTITKIEDVKWYNDSEVTLSEDFDYRAVRVKFDGKWKGINSNRILLLKNSRGEFDVQLVKWTDLVTKLASGTKALVESTEPVAQITVLTDYEQSVRVDGQAFGFMQDVNSYWGADDEPHVKYSLAWRSTVREISAYEEDMLTFNKTPIKKFDYIEYATGTLNKFNGGMRVQGLIEMSGAWTEKKSSNMSLVHLGAYAGVTNGYLKTNLGGEYKYLLLDPSGYSIYSANKEHTKFKSASLNDLVGKDIWAVSVGDMARSVFFEK